MSADGSIMAPGQARLLLDEPADVYYRRHLHEANSSGLKLIVQRSLAHFRHYVETGEDKDTPAKTFGRAFHCATLEPDVFDRTYAVLPPDAPDRPTQAMLNATGKRSENSQLRIDWWADWNAVNGDRIVLPAKDYDRARYMAQSIQRHPVAVGLITGGHREAVVRYVDDTDEGRGTQCKVRFDNYEPGEYMLDLKSCVDASPAAFARAVAGYCYDLQQAHYQEADRLLGHSTPYVILACESEAPYVCEPYWLGPMEAERGWNLRQRAIAKLAGAIRSGLWSGYSDGNSITTLTMPTWAFYGTEPTQA